MPIGRVLIGSRKREHFRVAIQLANERKGSSDGLSRQIHAEARRTDGR